MVETKVEKPFKCPYCGFQSLSKKVLDRHIAEEHPDIAKNKEDKKKKKSKVPTVGDLLSGKTALFYLRNGDVLKGKYKGITRYEIHIETEKGMVILFKHAIDYIEILDKKEE